MSATAPKPTVNDFRVLAAALPPTDRLQSSEVADVLGAVIAVITHGTSVLEAAASGKIADFYHEAAVTAAKASGADEPVKGNVPGEGVAPVAPGTPAGQIDYAKLAAAIVAAQNKAADVTAPPVPEVVSPPATEPSVTSPTDVTDTGTLSTEPII